MNLYALLMLIIGIFMLLVTLVVWLVIKLSVKDRVFDIQKNGNWRMVKVKLNGRKVEYKNLDGRMKTVDIKEECVKRMHNGGKLMIVKDGEPLPIKVLETKPSLDLDWFTDEVYYEMINSEHARLLASGKPLLSTAEKLMMLIGFVIVVILQVVIIAKVYNIDKAIKGATGK